MIFAESETERELDKSLVYLFNTWQENCLCEFPELVEELPTTIEHDIQVFCLTIEMRLTELKKYLKKEGL